VNNNFKDKNQVTEKLQTQNGITVTRIDQIVPTLEDVFIHLLEEKYNV